MGWHNHKDFKCEICGKDFQKKRQLKQHMRDAHDGEEKRCKSDGSNESRTQDVEAYI